jgi:hypothetical protein
MHSSATVQFADTVVIPYHSTVILVLVLKNLIGLRKLSVKTMMTLIVVLTGLGLSQGTRRSRLD